MIIAKHLIKIWGRGLKNFFFSIEYLSLIFCSFLVSSLFFFIFSFFPFFSLSILLVFLSFLSNLSSLSSSFSPSLCLLFLQSPFCLLCCHLVSIVFTVIVSPLLSLCLLCHHSVSFVFDLCFPPITWSHLFTSSYFASSLLAILRLSLFFLLSPILSSFYILFIQFFWCGERVPSPLFLSFSMIFII